jgi:hypothetical protein
MPGIVGKFEKIHRQIQINLLRLPVAVVLLLAATSAFGQDALSLSSGSVVAGQTISLDLSLTAPAVGGPAGLQWTLSYPAATFSSVMVVAGPAAVAAGKSVSCSGSSGSYTCMLFGLNNVTLSSGVVATATFTVSPSASGTPSSIQVLNSTGVTLGGTAVSVAATGGQVSIASPYTVTGLACSPATITTPGSAACTVTLSAPAPAGGLTVTTGLASGSGVTIPSAILVPAGSNSAGFTASASAVSTNSTAVLATSLNGTSQSFSLTLTSPPPPPTAVTLTGLACNSTVLTAHTSATCKITLSAAAPAGGLNIAIQATNGVSLSVPSSVAVPAGSSSARFSIQAEGINTNQTDNLMANLNGSSVGITLTLSESKHHR